MTSSSSSTLCRGNCDGVDEEVSDDSGGPGGLVPQPVPDYDLSEQQADQPPPPETAESGAAEPPDEVRWPAIGKMRACGDAGLLFGVNMVRV